METNKREKANPRDCLRIFVYTMKQSVDTDAVFLGIAQDEVVLGVVREIFNRRNSFSPRLLRVYATPVRIVAW
jgi:hypothetical protein